MQTSPYAGLVTRTIALLVDALVINVLAAIAGAAIGLIGSLAGSGQPGFAAALTGGVLWVGWTGLYFVAFWTVTGQTPGARLLGIRVVSSSPREVGIVRASLRFVVMMLALIPLGAGYVTVLFDDRRRGPHDMVASTVVRWASAAAPAAPVAVPAESAAAVGPAATPTGSGVAAGLAATPAGSEAAAGLAAAPAGSATPVTSVAPAPTGPPAAPAESAAPVTSAGPSAAPTPSVSPAVSGEVVGPARGGQGDDGAGPAAGERPGSTADEPPTRRLKGLPGS